MSMKIKTFEFVVNCEYGSQKLPILRDDNHLMSRDMRENVERENLRRKKFIEEVCSDPKEMDKTISKYLDMCKKSIPGFKVISINENYITTNIHNNGFDNTVKRVVTIVSDGDDKVNP